MDVIEHFYGVYLLYCVNPKYKGRIYVGFTVDPNRRIKQHNKGKKAGGAWRTSKRGPWVMALIVHGFPNDISALRFEWAWQHPLKSRRLNQIARKKTKETSYDYVLRVLAEMLCVGPWNRLPLTVRWLNDELRRDFVKSPPIHMPITHGAVISKKLDKQCDDDDDDDNDDEIDNQEEVVTMDICYLCSLSVSKDKSMTCLDSSCLLVSHIGCLGKYFVKNRGDYVPVEGTCPKCQLECLWGDLVRKYRGCYKNQNIVIDKEDFCDL